MLTVPVRHRVALAFLPLSVVSLIGSVPFDATSLTVALAVVTLVGWPVSIKVLAD